MKSSGSDFECEYSIPGYNLFHKDGEGREGGGVMLYVRDLIGATDCNITTDHEVLAVDLEIGSVSY